MNWLRKIGNWLWLNKERMVLAVMVAILVFRVYQVLNPPPPPAGEMLVRPRPEPPEGANILPGLPPPPPPPQLTDDWSRLWRRPIWTWVPATGGGATRDTQNEQQLNISLVELREVNGSWRARIRTERRTSWREEGEAFEQFTLMQIDSDRGCVTVFSDVVQRNLELCAEGR